MQQLQEATFDAAYDYRSGSPHLAHRRLYERLVAEVLSAVRDAVASGLPPKVLEVGAGHGGYTEPILAAGCRVTATEMSRAALERLQRRFGGNEHFDLAYDHDGSLDVLGDRRFAVVLCASVLHHIPDYESFCRRATDHLEAGGSFLSIQDPLWYPSVPNSTRRLDRLAYLSWRATRGDYRRGMSTLIRRIRGVYDDQEPGDMVEYHAVRNGVDQEALMALLRGRFGRVYLRTYWSTQAAIWQRVGEWAGARNTFMLRGEDYGGMGHADASEAPEEDEHGSR